MRHGVSSARVVAPNWSVFYCSPALPSGILYAGPTWALLWSAGFNLCGGFGFAFLEPRGEGGVIFKETHVKALPL